MRALHLAPALVAALSAALPACGTVTYVVQKYGGDARPESTIAVVRIQQDDALRVSSIDREPLDVQLADDTRMHVELLPGEHTIGVYKPDTDVPVAQHVRFTAQPGKTYRVLIAAASPGSPTSWAGRVYEVDRTSGTPIRDVTR